MRELRQRVAALALEKVEADLPNALTDEVQMKLVDQSIALLGGESGVLALLPARLPSPMLGLCCL